MVANLASFIKYLGHSNIAIKSIVTGEKGAQEGHFQAITINRAEDYIALRNGKRQLWINIQKLKPEIGKYISFNDIESYKNVYIDLDCEKPEGMKDYAATEPEREKALSQLPILQSWLESHGLRWGLGLRTGNGAGVVLPIPETKAEPVFIAKLATFLKLLQSDIPNVDTACFDPPRVIGIPGTINAKLETADRKNQVRSIVGEIPERVEDQALLSLIQSMKPDPAALKEWTKKYGEPQTQDPPKADNGTIDADDIIDRLTGILEADPKLNTLLGPHDKQNYNSRSDQEYGACGKLVQYGFADAEIDYIMCHVSKTGKWQEEGYHYRFEQTVRKLREAEAAAEAGKGDDTSTGTDTGTNADPKNRACIKLCGDLTKNEDEVLAAIYAYNSPPTLYQRGGALCRIKQISEDRYKIEDFTDFALRNEISRAATFQRFKPKKETEEDNEDSDQKKTKWFAVPCEPPINLVRGIMALDAWDIPYIKGLISAPVIRPDGSLLLEAGYDRDVGLCYRPGPTLVLPPIPENPTNEDATTAANFVMDEVLKDFPFVDDTSKANALAAFLTPIIRPMIKGCVPMALVDKPSPGTGASKLLDLISIVATGRPMAALSPPGDEEEWRKLITGLMRDGAALVCLDNIASDLKADALSRVLSSVIWKDRTLGKPDAVEYPQRACWYATGNNLTLAGDLPRRSYLIQLDAKMARPWERTTFRYVNINQWVEDNRGAVLAALLTMARAWVLADRPNGCKTIIGGYDEWVAIVGGILAYAGISGFLDNLSKLYEEVDIGSEEWGEFFAAWYTEHPDAGLTSSDVLDNARNSYTDMGKCVPSELAEKIKFPGPGDAKKVGLALRKKLKVRYKKGLMLTQSEDTDRKIKLRAATPP